MHKTMILAPIRDEEKSPTLKKQLKFVKSEIAKLPAGEFCHVTFEDLLNSRGLTLAEYLSALRCSIEKPTVFLKRSPNAVRVNAYSPLILLLWRSNIDIQFVLNAFAASKYICSFVAKAQKGMSKAMEDIDKHVKTSNLPFVDQMKEIA